MLMAQLLKKAVKIYRSLKALPCNKKRQQPLSRWRFFYSMF